MDILEFTKICTEILIKNKDRFQEISAIRANEMTKGVFTLNFRFFLDPFKYPISGGKELALTFAYTENDYVLGMDLHYNLESFIEAKLKEVTE